jgi:hypothetical protein
MAYGTNAPFGLQPRDSLYSSDFKLIEYQINPAYATTIFSGDPVTLLNDGTIGKWVPGNACSGTFWGCKFITNVPTSQGNVIFAPFWPGNQSILVGTTVTAMIHDAQATEYDVQASISGNVVAATSKLGIIQRDLNFNANLALGGTFTDVVRIAPDNPATGSIPGGLSRMYLDTSTISASSNLLLKILRLTPDPRNLLYTAPGNLGIGNGNQGAFNNVICRINNDVFNGGTGTPGGQVIVASGSLTAANINAMSGAPVQIIAAPGANLAVVVNSFVLSVSNLNNNTAFAGGARVTGLQYGNSANLPAGVNRVTATQPETIFTTQGALGPFTFSGVNVAPQANTAVFISNTVGNFTTGTLDYQYTVTYSIIPV